MAQIRKMDWVVEIKSSADKFYDAYKTKAQLMPKMSNQLITDIKLLQGDWGSVGSVKLWSYVASGKSETVKEMMETLDDENRTIVYKPLEGEVVNYYNNCKAILNVTPTGEGSLVKWTLEYEKRNQNVPDPVIYTDFYTTWFKNVDAYLLNA